MFPEENSKEDAGYTFPYEERNSPVMNPDNVINTVQPMYKFPHPPSRRGPFDIEQFETTSNPQIAHRNKSRNPNTWPESSSNFSTENQSGIRKRHTNNGQDYY